MVTAAGTAMANRLPVLLLPGDTFQGRAPDPVLQQVEHFADPTTSVNDAFRPVSRYFDRLVRPEQLIETLPQTARQPAWLPAAALRRPATARLSAAAPMTGCGSRHAGAGSRPAAAAHCRPALIESRPISEG